MNLTNEQIRVLQKVLNDRMFQYLIGGEEWDLTEAEETILWGIISASKDWKLTK